MKKILVTGGAGYLGSIFCKELLDLNYKVTVVDNFMFGQNSLAHLCYDPNISIVNADVRAKDVMTKLIKEADIIVPLAALVGAPLCSKDPIGATTINKDAILMMLKQVHQTQMILMPTTNSAYGTGDDNNFCTEESPLNPISQYAKEKVEVEAALMNHQSAISFRLATVFGMSPRMRIDLLVNDFTYRAVNDRFIVLFESQFKRNYIHVRDVARAFLHGIDNFDEMKGNIFNVGLSNANVSKEELCKKIKDQVRDLVYLDAPIGKDPDQRNYIVSNEKLEKTGYSPKFNLEQGISELIKGFATIKNTKYGNV